MKKQLLIIAFIIAFLALLIGFLLFRSAEAGPDLSAIDQELLEKESSGEFNPEDLGELLNYRFQEGKKYAYSFNRRVNARSKEETFLNLELSGHLEAHVLDRQGQKLDLLLVAKIEQSAGIEPTPDSQADQTFLNSAHAKISARGDVLELRFPPSMQDQNRQQIVNDLIANFLRVLPDLNQPSQAEGLWSKAEYTAKGKDTHGHYLALFSLGKADSNPVPLKMIKQKYMRSYTPVSIVSSEAQIAWNPLKGYAFAINSSESLQVGPPEFLVDSEQSADFSLLQISDSPYTIQDVLAFKFEGNLYTDELQELKARELASGTELKLDEARAVLGNVENQEEKQKHGTFRDLTTTFLRNPGTARALIGEANRFPARSDAFQMLMGAASYAASPEVQNALRELFSMQALDQFGKQSVLEAFILMEKPLNQESLSFLTQAFRAGDDLSASAGLALGNALRQKENADIHSVLEARWESAITLQEKMQALDYIGNSGDDSFFPIILEAMQEEALELQRKAVYATRFMEANRVTGFLIEELSGSGDTGVKEKATAAIGFQIWKDKFLAPLTTCVQREKASALRIKCADAVLNEPAQAENMKATLRGLVGSADEKFNEYIQVQLAE